MPGSETSSRESEVVMLHDRPHLGIRCPRITCGGTQHRVTHTLCLRGIIRRYRRCISCGKVFATIEGSRAK
jgi:hypothetical protein